MTSNDHSAFLRELRPSGKVIHQGTGYLVIKRLCDILLYSIVIIVMLIPSALICIAIVIDTPGNPLFIQRRGGKLDKQGRPSTFPMLKFRSMVKDAEKIQAELQAFNEADGLIFKMKDDPRITRVGRFLRSHSLDEVPQFVNVFLGQMSIVGPRPPLLSEVERYDAKAMRRLSVKPGVTGYWQVRAYKLFSFEDMLRLDLIYIEDRCLSTDVRVFLRTAGLVLGTSSDSFQ